MNKTNFASSFFCCKTNQNDCEQRFGIKTNCKITRRNRVQQVLKYIRSPMLKETQSIHTTKPNMDGNYKKCDRYGYDAMRWVTDDVKRIYHRINKGTS